MPARRGLPSCSTERPKPRRAFGPAFDRPHRALRLQFAMTKQVCRLPESGERLDLGGCCLLTGSQSSLALQFSRGRRLSFGSEGIAGGRRWELSRTFATRFGRAGGGCFFSSEALWPCPANFVAEDALPASRPFRSPPLHPFGSLRFRCSPCSSESAAFRPKSWPGLTRTAAMIPITRT